MDAVLRALGIYLFLLLIFRITGRRSMSEITTFDFVLLMIVGEATQQALLGDDFSIVNAYVVIAVLFVVDLALARVKRRWPLLDRLVDGVPLILVEQGRPLAQRLRRSRIEIEDVLEAARLNHGIERLDQIRYAVLEKNGKISIIPEQDGKD